MTKTLGELCKFLNGGTPSKAVREYYVGGTLPWISSADIKDGKVTVPRVFITPAGEKGSSVNVVKKGTVLLVTRTGVGKVALAPFELAFSQDITALIPGKEIHAEYLAAFLKASAGKLAAAARGATIPGVSRQVVESLKVDLPKLDEQRRIAETLDRIHDLRQKHAEAQRLVGDLVPAVFEEMIGIKKEKLSDLAEIRIGPFGSLLHKKDYVFGGVPLVNPSHIVDGAIVPNSKQTLSHQKINELGNYRLKTGDIILGRRGEIGRCALVTGKEDGYLCGTGSMFIRPRNHAHSQYLAKFLSSPKIRAKLESGSVGVTMKNLNASTVENLLVGMPTLQQQEKFSKRIGVVNSLTEKLGQRKNLLERLSFSLAAGFF